MMADSPLLRWLESIDAVQRDGEWVAPCPLYYERHRTGGDPLKVVVSPGRSRRVVVHCRSCGREALGDILTAWNVRSDDLERWAAATPSELWGGPPLDDDAVEYDFDLLHRAYTELLRLCPLTDEHRKWLRQRGVSDQLADYCGYGSLPMTDTQEHEEVYCEFDESIKLHLVPGLNAPRDLRGPGIAIPCRSEDGRIRAVKVRLTDGGRTRMRLLSSRRSGGLPAVSDLHFALPHCGDDGEAVCITEGERKADVVATRYRWKVVAVPGVGCVSRGVEYAIASRRGEVVLAFDRDAAGESATKAAVSLLRERGFDGGIHQVLWGGAAKGVDDAIAAGLPIRSVGGIEAIGPSPHRPPVRVSANLDSVRRLLGREVKPLTQFYREQPKLRRVVEAAIRGGELAFQKVRGVGGCVAVPELSEEEWRAWIASSTSAASATRGSGGAVSG